MFLYKNLFFSKSSILSIRIMLIGINGGYFPAICRVCLLPLRVEVLKESEVRYVLKVCDEVHDGVKEICAMTVTESV